MFRTPWNALSPKIAKIARDLVHFFIMVNPVPKNPGIWQNPVPENPGIENLDPARACSGALVGRSTSRKEKHVAFDINCLMLIQVFQLMSLRVFHLMEN